MKGFFPSFLYCSLLVLLLAGGNVKAQDISAPTVTPAAAPVKTMAIVYFYTHGYGSANLARFDLNGVTLDGLNEDALNQKFFRVNSAAMVLNFMAQHGYRAIGTVPMQHQILNSSGGDFDGYLVLFERQP